MLDKAINSDGTRLVPASILGLIVDLFCFFVQHHSYRIKYYVLRSHMVEKVGSRRLQAVQCGVRC